MTWSKISGDWKWLAKRKKIETIFQECGCNGDKKIPVAEQWNTGKVQQESEGRCKTHPWTALLYILTLVLYATKIWHSTRYLTFFKFSIADEKTKTNENDVRFHKHELCSEGTKACLKHLLCHVLCWLYFCGTSVSLLVKIITPTRFLQCKVINPFLFINCWYFPRLYGY